MSRKINKSRVEVFVEAYISNFKNTNNIRSERLFIRKAINLILAATSNSPCCVNEETFINLFTHRDNDLTNGVATLLIDIDKRRHKNSLLRTIEILRNLLSNPCCCTNISIIFGENFLTSYTTEDLQVRIYRMNGSIPNSDVDELIFQTEIGGDTTQVFCMRDIYFGIDNIYFCIASNVADADPGCAFTFMFDDAEPTLNMPIVGFTEEEIVCSGASFAGLVANNQYIVDTECSGG